VLALDASPDTTPGWDAHAGRDTSAHALPLCAPCHAALLAVRAAAARVPRTAPAAALLYLPFTPHLPDREDAAG
jgi:cytochrome c553